MRKRTLSKMLDSLFWFFLIIFPLVYAIVASSQTGINIEILTDFFKQFVVVDESSIIFTIISWFDSNVLALGIDSVNPLWLMVAWMFQVELMHLIVDIILVVFKIAQRLLDKVGVKE